MQDGRTDVAVRTDVPGRDVQAGVARPPLVYPILAFGLVSFASSAILIRYAHEAPGVTIAVWRTLLSVVLLLPVVALHRKRERYRFSRRDFLLMLGAGVLLALHFIMWIESLYYTSVASATVLVTTSPVFSAVLGYVLLGERISRGDIAGVLLATFGAALIGWGDASQEGTDSLFGNALALAAAVVFSLYLIIGRVVRQQATWLGYVFPLYCVVTVLILAFALVRETPLLGFSPAFYGLCLIMAIGPQLLGHGSFNYAIRYFSAALLGLLTLLEPVGATIMAYFLFDEVPGWMARVGILTVLASVAFVVARDQHRKYRGRVVKADAEGLRDDV